METAKKIWELCESEITTVIRNLTKIELTLKGNCSRLDIYVLTFM